jgi:hypothetical protein
VQQQHVDLVELQILQALLDRGEELALVEIEDIDLGGDEQIIARQAGFLERRAGLLFIFVHLRGIERPVAGFRGDQQGVAQFVSLQREGTETALIGLLKIHAHGEFLLSGR